jgi:hypothetical protein
LGQEELGCNIMLKFLKENFNWIKDIGIIIFLISIFVLNARYVTVERFEMSMKANELAHNAIQITLVSVDKTLALMQQNNTILIQNEKAIKDVNKLTTEMDLRLKLLENLGIEQRLKDKTLKILEIDLRLKLLEKGKIVD